MRAIKSFVIAGTNSGCGKTSVSLGIMGALARRGLAVSPFKVGPDFIDPGHHGGAASLGLAPGEERVISHNLDSWMLSAETLREQFQRYASGDVAVVEGVMGLFDGFSATEATGSTAQLAGLLGLPVILVINAASMARSVAALVSGFVQFDPDVQFAGVIFNRVGSERHAQLLTEAVNHALPEVPVLGWLRRNSDIALPSRHLGLVTADETDSNAIYHQLADWVEAGLDLDHLLAQVPAVDIAAVSDVKTSPVARIGIARDKAFCFYYQENLRLLAANGAELVEFSPLEDKKLPAGLDGLYLGGGYPELYGFELGQNASLRKELNAFSRAGKPIYAECGGFMFLLDALVGVQGGTYSMCGVFPGHATMQERFSALGYREITLGRDTILGPAGLTVRGHEFHYSRLDAPLETETVYAVRDRNGERLDEGYLVDNTLGSYIHLHFSSNPKVAETFVRACAARK